MMEEGEEERKKGKWRVTRDEEERERRAESVSGDEKEEGKWV